MQIAKFRHVLSRLLLLIAYGAVVFEWLWISLIIVPPLIRSGMFDALFSQSAPQSDVAITPMALSPVVVGAIGLITIAVLLITVVVMIRLPRTIVRSGEAIIAQTTEIIVPVVTHHKPIPAQERRRISRRVRLLIQVIVCVIPLAALVVLPETTGLSRLMVAAVTLLLGGIAATCFLCAWLAEPTSTTSRTRSHASRG